MKSLLRVLLKIKAMHRLSAVLNTDMDDANMRLIVPRESSGLKAAFKILVVHAFGTTKKVAEQPKILMQLPDGQPLIIMPQL